MEYHLPLLAMSEEQLSALLAKLKEDAGLQEKLKAAADPHAVVKIAKDAGFRICEDDWLNFQATQTQELSDEELEAAAGGEGGGYNTNAYQRCTHKRDLCQWSHAGIERK